jgi:hypothetical protein
MPSPTNRQIIIAPLSADTEESIRQGCIAQGCTCGERLVISIRQLADDERPPGTEDYGKATKVDVEHSLECPLLLATGRN